MSPVEQTSPLPHQEQTRSKFNLIISQQTSVLVFLILTRQLSASSVSRLPDFLASNPAETVFLKFRNLKRNLGGIESSVAAVVWLVTAKVSRRHGGHHALLFFFIFIFFFSSSLSRFGDHWHDTPEHLPLAFLHARANIYPRLQITSSCTTPRARTQPLLLALPLPSPP